VNENYKAKRNAFASNDIAAWQEILRREEDQLKEIKE